MAKKVDWNKRLEDAGFEITVTQMADGLFETSTGIVEKGYLLWNRFRAGWDIDIAYHQNQTLRAEYISKRKSSAANLGGSECQRQHGDKIRKNLNTGTPWNKDSHTGTVPWNKGLTKENDDRLMKLSTDRIGKGNPMYGISPTIAQRHASSVRVKENIRTGKFTPNIHNSWTHWQVEYNGMKYRSSWEAAWHSINSDYEYEKIRIPYMHDGVEHIYIVDFHNEALGILIEIKPTECMNDKSRAKEKYATEWANQMGWGYAIVSQSWFKHNIDEIMLTDLPDSIKDKVSNIR